MPKESEYGSTEHLIQSFKEQIIFIIVMGLFFCAVYYFYIKPNEVKKLQSASKYECGHLIEFYSSPDSDDPRNRNIDYFSIKNQQGKELHFVRSRRSDLGAKNAKQGDLVCLTYSTEYYEDFGKKVRDKKIPYLIKINSVGE
ncbi:hypothetical protein [Moraxella nonliquefaciens]|uniref:DUF3592 domain-containing protein n=2 Tax=Moraxella nonliquefaciens TaxID=478 RepID=A0A7T3F213_MORNO|nr:hypothetical protein [Moraxella nonliquefaciens]QPT44661.1 hypothetical protein I6G26_00965 [Moraxella nonliquefaciens]QPT45408.1 hypothetical protein I6G26_05380 [Moraxella nonliquefaciens]QQC29681.1 hypothetical protein I6H63_10425 [Moraxella nonliquefaciens]QQC30440.1 hypothetical protein I6H63_04165 [Moraxella nonliquefaciens]